MEVLLQFIKIYETYIYLILGGFAVLVIRRFILSWEEVRGAAFGLERESAQSKLNNAALLLVLVLMMAVTEFGLVYFVIPGVPGAMPLPTPTINVLATATTTLSADAAQAPVTTPASTISVSSTITSTGCIPNQLELINPKSGDTVSNTVTLIGTINLPNLGFYKYEIAHPGDSVWLTLQAGRGVKQKETLGEWNTTSLPAGDYLLHLVATDNQGVDIGSCQIQVHLIAPPQQ